MSFSWISYVVLSIPPLLLLLRSYKDSRRHVSLPNPLGQCQRKVTRNSPNPSLVLTLRYRRWSWKQMFRNPGFGYIAICASLLSLCTPPVAHALVIMARPRPASSQLANRKSTDAYLKGRVVWITGASSGLGEQLAIRAAEGGAEGLIISGRREEALERVRKECIAASPSQSEGFVRMLPFDVGDLEGVGEEAKKALREFGRVDVLVLNAGVSTRASVEETSLDVDKRVMAVNYLGCVGLAKGVLGDMVGQGKGHFVVINSVQGRFGVPFRASYAASKHALVGFFDCLRAEVAHRGVLVTTVFPGYIQTSLSMNALTGDGSEHARMDPTTAAGRDPREVAGVVWDATANELNELVIADVKVRIALLLRALAAPRLFKIMAKRALKRND